VLYWLIYWYTFINYDVIKINKHSINEVSAHDHFHSHSRASVRRSPPGLPAIIYNKNIYNQNHKSIKKTPYIFTGLKRWAEKPYRKILTRLMRYKNYIDPLSAGVFSKIVSMLPRFIKTSNDDTSRSRPV